MFGVFLGRKFGFVNGICHSSYLLGDLMVRPYLVTIGSEFALMFGFCFLGDIDLSTGDLFSDSDDLLLLLFAGSWTASCAAV